MSERTTYEIVLRGRPSTRLLRPLLDDFTVDTSVASVTRLVGEIADRSHLHGLLAHVTSVNLDLVSIAPVQTAPVPAGVAADLAGRNHPRPANCPEHPSQPATDPQRSNQ